MRIHCAVAVLILWSSPSPADPNAWPQFRGANGDGIVREQTLPLTWSEAEGVAWKAPIPGFGWSQPIVWGDRIFVTTAVTDQQPQARELDWSPGVSGVGFLLGASPPPPDLEYRWKLLCLNAATGELLWERTAKTGKPQFHVHPSNSYASETPATNGKVVLASFGMAGLYAYDFEGTLLWSKELGVFPTQLGWGTGSSPILDQDRVFLQCDYDRDSFLAAFELTTGDEIWRKDRAERSNWSSPYLWRHKDRTELVTAGGSKMRSYDPDDGTVLWEMNASGRTAATPVGNDHLLFVDSYERLTGRSGLLVAIRPGAAGDLSLPENAKKGIAWQTPLSGYRVASPTLVRGQLYVFEQQGGITHCFDAESGTRLYRQRLPEAKGVMASPLATEERLYVLDHEGHTIVLEAGPEMKVLAANTLDDLCWASAAAANGRLYIRGAAHLYCIQGVE